MAGKGFTFKQFEINHEACAMKVGTDGTLIGAWASIPYGECTVLDIGTGTGLIAIMAAQRAPQAQIVGIDIDSDCIEQARENVAASPWSERISIIHSPLQEFTSTKGFDVNQKFGEGYELDFDETKRILQEHDSTLSAEQVVSKLFSGIGTKQYIKLREDTTNGKKVIM